MRKVLLIIAFLLLPLAAQALWRQKPQHEYSTQKIEYKESKQISCDIARAQDLGSKDTVRVLFVGDVMMHAKQIYADHNLFFSQIGDMLKEADICVANMEFTLAGEPYTGYPRFSAPDSFAELLCGQWGVDIFLTANNHILDYGSKGLVRTLEQYSKLREQYAVLNTGSARDQSELSQTYPLMRPCKGVRFAFVNFTYATNIALNQEWPKVCRQQEDEVCAAVTNARERGADFVIALPHWGIEYELTHSPKQEKWAKMLISWGVDAVVGTHPHVVQDSQVIDGRPVFYSLGNIVSNMTAKNTQRGQIVVLRFEIDRHTNIKRMLEPEVYYTFCHLPEFIVRLETD